MDLLPCTDCMPPLPDLPPMPLDLPVPETSSTVKDQSLTQE